MRRFALVLLLILAATPLCVGCCTYFYGGDLDLNDPNQNGLANENDAIVGGSPYGAATYQNFVVFGGVTVGGLFTNDLMNEPFEVFPTARGGRGGVSTAYWEIRSGVSEGNGGTLIASGSGRSSVTPTGRSDFGYTEYHNEVDDLNVFLNSGTY